MSHEVIASLIKSISGQANTLAIPRVYINLLEGDIEAALFLSQCVYWSDKTKNKNGFYKSASEWQEETGLTRYKVSRCAKACQRWVATSLHRANGAPTLHYRLDLQSLCQSVSDLLVSSKSDLQETSKSDFQVSSKCLTEITQETTREVAKNAPHAPKKLETELGVIRLVKTITGKRSIPVELYEILADTLTSQPDEARLRDCWVAWRARGFSRDNYAWALEWYKTGIPQGGRQAGAKSVSRDLPSIASTEGGFYA